MIWKFISFIQNVVKVKTKSAIEREKAEENARIAEEERQKQAAMELTMRKKAFCARMAHVYNPIGALSFVAIYWAIGLKNAQFF